MATVAQNVWRSTLGLLKESASNAGASAIRRRLEAARQALRDNDPQRAWNLADGVASGVAVIAEAMALTSLVGAAHVIAARAKDAEGDHAAAAAAASKGIEILEPRRDLDGLELSELGLAMIMLGRNDGIGVLIRAVETGGATPEAYIRLATHKRDDASPGEAVGYLRDALGIVPDDPLANALIGDLLADLGRVDEATDHLARAGLRFGANGALDQAEHWLNRANELSPDELTPLLGLSELNRLRGELDAAIALAERAVAVSPESAAPYIVLGRVLYEAGDATRAIAQFERALAIEHDDVDALAGYAIALSLANRVDEALSVGKRAADANTDEPIPLALAAEWFVKNEDEDEAIRLYTRAVEIDPDNEALRRRLVELLVRESDEHAEAERNEIALEYAERAVVVDPESAIANAEMASVLSKLKRWQDALAAANRAVELSPNESWGHLERAVALLGLDQIEQAAEAARAAVELEPHRAPIWTFLGEVLAWSDEQLRDALESFRRALSVDADERGAVLGLSDACQRLGLDAEAAEPLNDYTQRHPEDTEVLRRLGLHLYHAGRDEEAIIVLERAARLDPRDTEVRHHIGLAYAGVEQWSNAVAVLAPVVEEYGDKDPGSANATLAFAWTALDRHSDASKPAATAIRLAPNVAFGWQVWASLLADAGWFDDAVAAARQAIELDPMALWPRQTIAWAIERSSDTGGAEDAWNELRELSPDDPWPIKGLANSYAALGRDDDAVATYRSALALLDAKGSRGSSDDSAVLDSLDLWNAAWCRLCLGEYPEAVSLLVSSLVAKNEVGAQFDLALTMMCGGQTHQSTREYGLALESLVDVDQLRTRGLLIVAIADIDRFMGRFNRRAEEAGKRCRVALSERLAEVVSLHPSRFAVDGINSER